MATIPLVDYLVLDGDEGHLEANECTSCGAVFLDRRNACARCGAREFGRLRLADEGGVRSFSIIHRAAPGVPAPFVSAVVDLTDGHRVKANLVGVEPTPDQVKLGMPVTLTTFVAGTDDNGTDAVAFGYRPR